MKQNHNNSYPLSDVGRNEEVQDIINRMPTSFSLWILILILIIFIFLAGFGWAVKYPDVVSGEITVNASRAPLKLIANSSGKLKLNGLKNFSDVTEGQHLAFLENSTQLEAVVRVDSLIKKYNPNDDSIIVLLEKLPRTISLGALNGYYHDFLASLQQLKNFVLDDVNDEKSKSLTEILSEQRNSIAYAKERIEISKSTLKYASKFYKRDSVLFSKKVISEFELDKSKLNYITSKDSYQSSLNALTTVKQQLQQTKGSIRELEITKPERDKELRRNLISSYNELLDNITNWQQKYVFRAPFDGKIQFLKFYTENQFVQSGEEVFTIIPNTQKPIGQMIVPAQGSGKIKIGQEVIIKLDNYPYREYGSVSGKVNSISLITTTTKTSQNEIETYQLLIDFPNNLVTNYGTMLEFKFEAKGGGEVITNDRRLIERLFDNLKYTANN